MNMASTGDSAGIGMRRKQPADRIQIPHKQKIAFVCSGGATKAGAFHLGVALALQEQGFKFLGGIAPTPGSIRTPDPMEISTYVGSSAGSIISTYLAAGYSLENIFNSFLGRKPTDPIDAVPKILPTLTYQKMFRLRPGLAKEQMSQLALFKNIFNGLVQGNWESILQFKWLKTTGIFSTAGVEQFMREEVLPSNKFQDYMADLFIVATQLNHSRKVVFGKYNYQPPAFDLTCQYDNDVAISDACAASTALPFIYAPYPIKNQNNKLIYYIDGEIRDTLSTHVAVDAGADLVIASYTHQPYHFQKEIGSLTEHGLPAILIQSIYLLIEQKINNHIHSKQVERNAILAVSRYCKQQGVGDEHRKRICEIMEAELHHRMDVDTIYIHPLAGDAHMFFGEHFSLSPKKLAEIVKSGFRAAIDTLRKYEFQDKLKR
ncbi:MAG: patatin-like phospholipase family protein [Methylotenera sp.]|nr:patatin-like phospholipase family protein [Oligoflexia bacterium]